MKQFKFDINIVVTGMAIAFREFDYQATQDLQNGKLKLNGSEVHINTRKMVGALVENSGLFFQDIRIEAMVSITASTFDMAVLQIEDSKVMYAGNDVNCAKIEIA